MNLTQSLPRRPVPPAAAVELVATLDAPPVAGDAVFRLMPKQASWLRVRADLVGDVPSIWLRQTFAGRLLYTLRSPGRANGNDSVVHERWRRLIAAAAEGYDLVELDAERDITSQVLEAISPGKRLICWRGTATSASDLASTFRHISRIDAACYLLVVDAQHPSDGLAPLSFLRSAGRRDVIAYADGDMGLWSRILASHLGSPMIFGGGRTSSAEPCAERLIRDFGLPALPPVDRIFGIAGARAADSLSPFLHNAAYRALGYPGLFLPFGVDSFDEFWRDVVQSNAFDEFGVPVHGLTVASPNKEAATAIANTCSRASRRSASANLVVRRGPAWASTTTDPTGVLANVPRRSVSARRAAVVGCGGSGRAIAWALRRRGAAVTLVNRCKERGQQASRLLRLPFAPLSAFSAHGYDLVINATPVGSRGDELPFAIEHLDRNAVVVDLVYTQWQTPLVRGALVRGIKVVDGRQVLLTQVEQQFERMTGLAPPPGLMADLLGLPVAPRLR
jgi:3-dehydroquinate dehydratase/shikimate dehydrogenase